MLTDIFIKNFAIIDELHIVFAGGLTVLTGETGAGKSIIIDAVNLLLGGRASADLIRSGADDATVEAIFAIDREPALKSSLAEMGLDQGDELLLRRVLSRSGKNRIFINGSLATLATLADLATRLVNIYGQHESQTLLKVENHLALLDGYGSLDCQRESFATTFRAFRKVRERIELLETRARDAERQKDLLAYQLDEIDAAAPVPGEDDELEKERNLLVHAERLLQKCGSAYELIYGAEESALGILGKARNSLQDAAGVDGSLEPLCGTIDTAVLQLEDAAFSLRDYIARVEADPLRLQFVDERLELLRKLKRKYGATVADVIVYRQRIETELRTLTELEDSRADLEQEAAGLSARMRQEGEALSAGRGAAALRLQQALEEEVQQLAMKHARFLVEVESLAEPRESGYDRVEILFSPNPGELPKPLVRIASGGELSRIMLAMKQLHPESDVPTLVFDEVDTGIGGATSSLVGQKLKAVAGRQQVLCITHMPQVAVFADHHFLVSKRVDEGRTVTSLQQLGDSERRDEIARMLGGVSITAKTREHAAEMIEAALGTGNDTMR